MIHGSIWPLVAAAGISLIAFGGLTHPAFSLFGLALTARALAGWVAELRHG